MVRYLFLVMSFFMTQQRGFCLAETMSSDIKQALKIHTGEPSYISIVLSLVFVVALIYITGVIYSKLNILGANTVKKQLKDRNFDKAVVLSTTQLGQGSNLHVIEINDKKVLLGATQHSIHMLKELGEEDFAPKENGGFETIIKEKIETEETAKAEKEFELYKKYL